MVALCGPCRNGQRGTAMISHAQLRTIRAGRAYVNVHTRKNGAGEIRGQLKATEGGGSGTGSTSTTDTTRAAAAAVSVGHVQDSPAKSWWPRPSWQRSSSQYARERVDAVVGLDEAERPALRAHGVVGDAVRA